MPLSTRRLALLLIALCSTTRLAFFLAVAPWEPGVRDDIILRSDAIGYHELARNLALHQEFTQQRGAEPEALRTPLYPLFVASFYCVFGPHPWIVLLAQVLLDSLTCALLFAIVERALSRPAALAAALFYALDPFLVFFSVTLMSEVLFLFACVAALGCLTIASERGFARRSLRWVAAAAFALGLATLVRPIAMFLPAVLCLVLVWSLRARPALALQAVAVFVIGFAATLAPWLARNYATFGAFSLSTSGPYNLLVWNVGPMEMKRTGLSALETRESLLAEAERWMQAEGISPAEANEFERAHFYSRLAMAKIAERPLEFLDRYGFGIAAAFANLGTRGYADMLGLRSVDDPRFDLRQHSGVVAVATAAFAHKTPAELCIGAASAGFLFVSYACLLVGFWEARKARGVTQRAFLLLCASLALYFILITGTAGLARFRAAATPFLLPFIGLGVAALRARLAARQQPIALEPIGVRPAR